jgi:GTP-binding protein
MKITSAEFVKGVVGEDRILEDGKPQVAFIGRSNVGKSSTINSLVGKKDMARTSRTPGRTQEMNVFLINNKFYLVDLPGYGFAKMSLADRNWLHELINWYLFNPYYQQKKIVLIIDAEVGPTNDDLEMLQALDEQKKPVLIVANKIDKIKKSDLNNQLKKLQDKVGNHKLIPYSSKKGVGYKELAGELLQ